MLRTGVRPSIVITLHALQRYYARVLPPGASMSEREVRATMTQCIRAGEPLSPMQRRAFAGPRRIAPEDEFIRNTDVIYILRRSKRESLLRCLTVFIATDAQVEMMQEIAVSNSAPGDPPTERPVPSLPEMIPAPPSPPATPATPPSRRLPDPVLLQDLVSGLVEYFHISDDAVIGEIHAALERYPWVRRTRLQSIRNAWFPLRAVSCFQHLTQREYRHFVIWLQYNSVVDPPPRHETTSP